MSEWKRNSRELSFDNLPPELVSAIHQHVERYNLGSILSDALMCIQTDSEKAKKGLFGKPEQVQVGMMVTPRWLLWAMQGTQTPPTVLSALLQAITVQDYAQTSYARMIPDSGLEVSGIFTDASEPVSAFLGLDDGAAAKKFKEIVIRAVQDAKK